MGWADKAVKAFRKVYDATSKGSSSFGKFGKYTPMGSQYWVRDLWRKTGKKYLGASGGAANLNISGSSASQLANTGFRRYI